MAERNLDFDRVVNRKNTGCLKYDFAVKRGYPAEVLPLWVADMDFQTSSYIRDALAGLSFHNIYGYTNTQHGDGFFDAVSGWMKRHHNWTVQEEWHVKTPSVSFAIAMAIKALTKEGDSVIIQEPVYYPFKSLILKNGRKAVSSDLYRDESGRYQMDFENFERKVADNKVKLFILCNPHNPVGRVWTREELEAVGEICRRRGVFVFSDDIHFDFVFKGEHVFFQEVKEEYKDFTITATSPSKTFNLAGLQQANIFIPNKEIRGKIKAEIDKTGYDEPNAAGITAARAAYESGDVWYEACKSYIAGNIEFADRFLKENLPGVSKSVTEGTYLIWLDCRGICPDPEKLDDLVINKAKLWLDSGKIFGNAGTGFQRINVACPRVVLREALERLSGLWGRG
ncbi:MAG: pyridoxal phosphate-dependent aminotransferase [Lachnospiraceae bacterium]|nr:pyridoxal phosphate-dependent aminotransferase [Lachnospiraceae bacterium]